jgi:hypothetical protein
MQQVINQILHFSYLLVFLVLLSCFARLCCFEEKSIHVNLTRHGSTKFQVSHQSFRVNKWLIFNLTSSDSGSHELELTHVACHGCQGRAPCAHHTMAVEPSSPRPPLHGLRLRSPGCRAMAAGPSFPSIAPLKGAPAMAACHRHRPTSVCVAYCTMAPC